MPFKDVTREIKKVIGGVRFANSLFDSINGDEVKLDATKVFQRTKLYADEESAEVARDNPEAEAYVDQVVNQWRDRLIRTIGGKAR